MCTPRCRGLETSLETIRINRAECVDQQTAIRNLFTQPWPGEGSGGCGGDGCHLWRLLCARTRLAQSPAEWLLRCFACGFRYLLSGYAAAHGGALVCLSAQDSRGLHAGDAVSCRAHAVAFLWPGDALFMESPWRARQRTRHCRQGALPADAMDVRARDWLASAMGSLCLALSQDLVGTGQKPETEPGPSPTPDPLCCVVYSGVRGDIFLERLRLADLA